MWAVVCHHICGHWLQQQLETKYGFWLHQGSGLDSWKSLSWSLRLQCSWRSVTRPLRNCKHVLPASHLLLPNQNAVRLETSMSNESFVYPIKGLELSYVSQGCHAEHNRAGCFSWANLHQDVGSASGSIQVPANPLTSVGLWAPYLPSLRHNFLIHKTKIINFPLDRAFLEVK